MKKLLLISMLFLSFNLKAQPKLDIQIELITPEVIANATLDQEKFISYLKECMDNIKNALVSETENRDIVVMYTFHKDKNPDIQIGARPNLKEAIYKKLETGARSAGTIQTKYVDYSVAFYIRINEGGNSESGFSPDIKLPIETSVAAFKSLDISKKPTALQNWIKDEILPMLEHYTTSVDEKFAGVRAMGEILKNKEYLKKSVSELTDHNMKYWRAVLEMEKKNMLIPFIKACMHIANGEFDAGSEVLFFVNLFSDESTVPAFLYEEINAKLTLLTNELNNQINEGIKLHDAGKYKDAVKHYTNLLKYFPRSAWLNYELYFSKTAEYKKVEDADKEWFELKPKLYSYFPMYSTDVRARNKKEGYLLYRRSEIASLFKSKEEMKKDIVKYADIALDLENYGIAAQTYWYIINYFNKDVYDNRNIMAHFLYALHKMGDDFIITNFKDELKDEFPKIEEALKKQMEENIMYKAFKE